MKLANALESRKTVLKNRDERLTNPSLHKIIGETFFAFAIVGFVYLLLFTFAGEQIDDISLWSVENLGYPGVFLFVLTVDTFIVPATADFIFPLTLEWNRLLLLSVVSIASISGGLAGFLIARGFGSLRIVQGTVGYYRQKGETLIKKFGVWAVVLAGLTPLPYSTISWIAGMSGMKLRWYILASLSRIPRFALYMAAIESGLRIFQLLNLGD